MMYIKINYGTAVTTLPRIDSATLARATADDLRVLFGLCSADTALAGDNLDALAALLGETVGCGVLVAAASIAFWRGTGVLELTETNTPEATTAPAAHVPTVHTVPNAPNASNAQTPSATPNAQPTPESNAPAAPTPESNPPVPVTPDGRVKVRRAAEFVPNYTHAEMQAMMEKKPEIRENIHECNRIWGNFLNLSEIASLLLLSEYLGLEWDYILSLVARCVADMKRLGNRPSMHYVQKQATNFVDEGITTLDALQEKFRAMDMLRSAEGKLRTLFGMSNRAMSPSEKKYFSTWLYDFGYTFEIIEMAYNIAVDTKGEARKPYINSILSNWNEQNLRTIPEIEAAQAARRVEMERKRAPRKAPPPAPASGSFDTDNFFDAAVRRSFEEDNGNPQT